MSIENQQNTPLVSVIIPAYNAEKYICDTIDSILVQTHRNLEIIVVNDCSTDNTAQLLAQYKDERLQIITSEQNVHVILARNLAHTHAKGKYIAYCDADDMWQPTKIEEQLAIMEADPDIGVSFTWAAIIDENNAPANLEIFENQWHHDVFHETHRNRKDCLLKLLTQGNYFCNSSAMVRSSVIDQIGLQNPALLQLQDYEYWVRILNLSSPYLICKELTLYRRVQNSNSISSTNEYGTIRTHNESVYVCLHFFDFFTDEDFAALFRDLFSNPNANTHTDLQCEKAFLLKNAHCGNEAYISAMQNLLATPETTEALFHNYGFSPKDFYALNKENRYWNPSLHRQFQELLTCTQELHAKIVQQNMQLDEQKQLYWQAVQAYDDLHSVFIQEKKQLVEERKMRHRVEQTCNSLHADLTREREQLESANRFIYNLQNSRRWRWSTKIANLYNRLSHKSSIPSKGNFIVKIIKKTITGYRIFRQYGLRAFLQAIRNKFKGIHALTGIAQSTANEIPVESIVAGPAFPNSIPVSLFEAVNYLSDKPRSYPSNTEYSCSVVIPVYNGLEHLERLFPSLEKNTPSNVEILVVNDGSPDARILPFIQSYVNRNANWKLLENDRNYGFVKTVNNGMAKVHTDYAILLNTDTVVPENWIPKMITPFLENDKIATTTPFTNAGVYFSFPRFGEDNAPYHDLDTINRAFDYVVSNEYGLNEIFSGTGFCMGVNMACWNEIGGLDYENFGKGYGEENDWCFRALNNGWRHLLVPNLYIQHFHGGSFMSEEKKALCAAHHNILLDKYSDIMSNDIPTFQYSDPWKVYRFAAALKMAASNATIYINLKPLTTDVSGAVDYSSREISEICSNDQNLFIVQYVRGTTEWSVVPYSVDPTMEIPMDDIMDLEWLFEILDVKKVIVNNFAFCENTEKATATIRKLKKSHTFELVYKFHDYLSICPSFFLINDEIEPCTPSNTEYCKDCLRKNSTKAVQRNYPAVWRKTFDRFFRCVDQFQFFSYYSRDIVCQIYPQVAEKSTVKYHEPLFTGNESIYKMPQYNGQWNFAFVGSFLREKGSKYFIEMKEMLEENGVNATFKIFGQNMSGIPLNGIQEFGRYNREDLGKLLTENNIHVVLYPSINNETFSYVAQELMMLNVPLVVFPCGAPQERIKAYEYSNGKVADRVTAESLYHATDLLVQDVYQRNLFGNKVICQQESTT